MEMQDTANDNNAPPCPCVNTACLGPYPSAREPLKAGLDSDDDDDDSDDDDSSIDSSTDNDGSEADDEFFFGDVDDFMSETENMFQKMRERFPAHHMMSGSGSSSSPKVSSGGIGGISSAHRRTSCPSLADTTAASTDVSAMDTSSDDGAVGPVPATIRGFHSYSTGTFQHTCNPPLKGTHLPRRGKKAVDTADSVDSDTREIRPFFAYKFPK